MNASASCIEFQLHTLGWKAFQQLCLTIMSERLGQTVQSFFDSNDGGRDGAFRGEWKHDGSALSGSFTVQCKYTSKRDQQLRQSQVVEEFEKAKRLAGMGFADNYILMTNAHLTGVVDEEIRQKFEAIPGLRRCLIFGQERITQFIHESPRLRMLVPRIYGLGDLSQIFDERAQAQAVQILSALGGDLNKFVMTTAHRRSAEALLEHGFVLLLGEPACGKSTIAAALAMGALDEWGFTTFKSRNAEDFIRHWNPNDEKQFFWVDDAFGATQLDYGSVIGWNQSMPHVQAAIKKGARVLFTSRDYVYRSARQYLKESAFPLLREYQVVINVQELTLEEREQILYNHIRLGNQPARYKTRIKPFLHALARRRTSTPEVARRLGNPVFTKGLTLTEKGLVEFADRQEVLLQEVIRTLDNNSRSAIAMVFMRGGALESPVTPSPEEERAIQLIGGSSSGVRSALDSLKGSLVVFSQSDGRSAWGFKHPTIRDAFASLIAEDPELLDIYIAGTPALTLLGEVSCGESGIAGVRLNVPVSRYGAVINKIKKSPTKDFTFSNALHTFLASRCDRQFIVEFLAANVNFISGLRVGSYLYAVSDVDVLARLHALGLLPEEKRLDVVERIKHLSVDTPDSGFLQGSPSALLRDDEKFDIKSHVVGQLPDRLDRHIRDVKEDWNGRDDPSTTFSELEETLKEYRQEFAENRNFVRAVDLALVQIESIINELEGERAFSSTEDSFSSRTAISHHSNRSIFEDVDAPI